MDVVQTSLSLFMPPPIDNSIQREYWVEFNPLAAISGGGVIEFNIPGTSVDYVNLAKTKLQVSYAITHADGKPIVDDRVYGVPTADSDQVGPVNLTLHSIFDQIDLSLIESQAEAGLFHKDQAERFEEVTYLGNNPAFAKRASSTKGGGTATLEECLYSDFATRQSRAVLNGVSINLKLFQASNEFRLMRNGSKIYKLQRRSAVLKVCHVSLNPSLIIVHNESLKLTTALYPFWRSDLKSFSMAQGSLTFTTDNIFHGKVPSKMIIGMVSNSAYSGDFSKNPFNFKHMDANYLEVTVDGQPVPNRPYKPNYEENDYVSSYLSLFDSDLNKKKGIIISLSEYPNRYCLYLFDIQSFLRGKIMTRSKSGHVRLSIRYDLRVMLCASAKFA